METLFYLLKFTACAFIIAAIAFIAAWYFVKRNREWLKYDDLMIEIESLVKYLPVTPENFDHIMRLIDEKDRCKYQDKRRNKKMFTDFSFKYRNEHTKRVSEI